MKLLVYILVLTSLVRTTVAIQNEESTDFSAEFAADVLAAMPQVGEIGTPCSSTNQLEADFIYEQNIIDNYGFRCLLGLVKGGAKGALSSLEGMWWLTKNVAKINALGAMRAGLLDAFLSKEEEKLVKQQAENDILAIAADQQAIMSQLNTLRGVPLHQLIYKAWKLIEIYFAKETEKLTPPQKGAFYCEVIGKIGFLAIETVLGGKGVQYLSDVLKAKNISKIELVASANKAVKDYGLVEASGNVASKAAPLEKVTFDAADTIMTKSRKALASGSETEQMKAMDELGRLRIDLNSKSTKGIPEVNDQMMGVIDDLSRIVETSPNPEMKMKAMQSLADYARENSENYKLGLIGRRSSKFLDDIYINADLPDNVRKVAFDELREARKAAGRLSTQEFKTAKELKRLQ